MRPFEELTDKNSVDEIEKNDNFLNRAFELFETEYLKETGKSWSRSHFLHKSKNWRFFGNQFGYVAVRVQNTGFWKMVGAAGSNRSKLLALKLILNLDVPIWGMVSQKIKDMALKIGLRGPNFVESIFIERILQSNSSIMGKVEIKKDDSGKIIKTKDGGIFINMTDAGGIGEVVKYFIASKKYWSSIAGSGLFKKLVTNLKSNK